MRCVLAGDDHLKVWRKQEAPAIAGPPKGMPLTGFRDPFVIRKGSSTQPWLLIIGSGLKDQGGTILLYQSDHAASGRLLSWCPCHSQAGQCCSTSCITPVGSSP